MDPHLCQQHAGLQHKALQPQQEVTRPKARFKPTLPKKSGVDGGAMMCHHIFVSLGNFSAQSIYSYFKNDFLVVWDLPLMFQLI